MSKEISPLTLEGHACAITALAFNPDASLLASADYVCGVRLWDPKSGKLKMIVEPARNSIEGVYGTAGLAFSPDGWVLAACLLLKPSILKFWDVANGLARSPIEVDEATSLSWSPDGNYLACGMTTGVSVRDGHSGTEIELLTGHRNVVTDVAWSDDGKLLASGTCLEDEMICIWDIEARKPRTWIDASGGYNGNIEALAFQADTSLIWTKGYGRLFQWESGTQHKQLLFGIEASAYPTALQHDGKSLAYETHHGERMSGSRRLENGRVQRYRGNGYSSVVHVVNIKTKSEIALLSGHIEEISTMTFSPAGHMLATGDRDGRVCLWDIPQAS